MDYIMTYREYKSDRSLATGIIDPVNEVIFSINATNPAEFDHTGGKLQFVDGYTDPDAPVVTIVEVPARTGIPVDNILTTSGTFVYFDINGDVIQEPVLKGGEYLRDHVAGTILVHGGTIIDSSSSFTSVALSNMTMGFADLSFAIGNAGTTEHDLNKISGVSGTTKVEKAEGSFYYHAINARTDNKTPNIIQSAFNDGAFMLLAWSVTDLTVGKFVPSFTGITPGIYDDGTSTSADSLPQGIMKTNEWVNNRILFGADSNTLVVQYGKTLYKSAVAARIGLPSEDFDVIPVLLATVALGVFTMRGGATDTADTNDCIVTQAMPIRAHYQ